MAVASTVKGGGVRIVAIGLGNALQATIEGIASAPLGSFVWMYGTAAQAAVDVDGPMMTQVSTLTLILTLSLCLSLTLTLTLSLSLNLTLTQPQPHPHPQICEEVQYICPISTHCDEIAVAAIHGRGLVLSPTDSILGCQLGGQHAAGSELIDVTTARCRMRPSHSSPHPKTLPSPSHSLQVHRERPVCDRRPAQWPHPHRHGEPRRRHLLDTNDNSVQRL